MVGADFARIDETGRLVFRGSASKEQEPAKATQLQVRRHTSAKTSQTEPWQYPAAVDNAKPSLSLRNWLDYYQAKSASQIVVEKLEQRRDNAGLHGLSDEEPGGHLENSIHWLERVAGAVTILQEMRQEHIAILKGDSVLPVGRCPSALLAEWSGCGALDILAQALPELVDQVELYEDSLINRGRRNRDEDELRMEVSRLSEQLKTEKRQRDFYWRKLREIQQAGATSRLGLGAADDDSSASEFDNGIPMYTEKDMKAFRKEMLAKMEALDKDWQERFDAEQRKAWELQADLRREMEALQQQLKVYEEEVQQLRSSSSSRVARPQGSVDSSNIGDAAGDAATANLSGFSAAGTGARKTGANTSGFGDVQKHDQRHGPGERPQDGTSPKVKGPKGQRAGRRQHRPSSALGERPDNDDPSSWLPEASSSATSDTDPDATALATRPRPQTAPASSNQQDETRSVANRRDPGSSGDEHRRMAEDLKRRMFESVLAEERKRQQQMDDMEQNALAARWELQGQAELTQLIRRIDDQILRRDIFRLLKTYCKRSPMAMEIVCVYCRRKPRHDQIHSFDTPSRPGSANRTSCIQGPAIVCAPPAPINTIATTQPAPAVRRPSTALPRVSSSPAIGTTTQNGSKAFEDVTLPMGAGHMGKLESRRDRPPKLQMQQMTAIGFGAKAAAAGTAPAATLPQPLRERPAGWSDMAAAC